MSVDKNILCLWAKDNTIQIVYLFPAIDKPSINR